MTPGIRYAGDPEVLRLLALDRRRKYLDGAVTDEELGLLERAAEHYDPDSQLESYHSDSADPNMVYLVDPQGYGSYWDRRYMGPEMQTLAREQGLL